MLLQVDSVQNIIQGFLLMFVIRLDIKIVMTKMLRAGISSGRLISHVFVSICPPALQKTIIFTTIVLNYFDKKLRQWLNTTRPKCFLVKKILLLDSNLCTFYFYFQKLSQRKISINFQGLLLINNIFWQKNTIFPINTTFSDKVVYTK